MNNQIITEVISEFKRFLDWENQSFDGWEKIDVFIAETLSEAWLSARPYDAYKFLDEDFKEEVDEARGKWLEKTTPTDSYKIILSTKYCDSIQSLTTSFVHEMRHCLDYQNAVKDLPFEDYHPGNRYYNDWSEFRAVYSHTRYEFFSKYTKKTSVEEVFNILAEILGRSSAKATTGLILSKNSKDTLYYISRYIGASRAIQNIKIHESINREVFQKWTMTPQYIIEKFGYDFYYLGSEWDETETCELDAMPKTYYYLDLAKRIATRQEV